MTGGITLLTGVVPLTPTPRWHNLAVLKGKEFDCYESSALVR